MTDRWFLRWLFALGYVLGVFVQWAYRVRRASQQELSASPGWRVDETGRARWWDGRDWAPIWRPREG